MPRLEKPDTSKPRLLNLRTYESHNERAAKKKIEMFNKGELAIFRRVGLTPVLFGETVVGPAMPNLTYPAGVSGRCRPRGSLVPFPGRPGVEEAESDPRIRRQGDRFPH